MICGTCARIIVDGTIAPPLAVGGIREPATATIAAPAAVEIDGDRKPIEINAADRPWTKSPGFNPPDGAAGPASDPPAPTATPQARESPKPDRTVEPAPRRRNRRLAANAEALMESAVVADTPTVVDRGE